MALPAEKIAELKQIIHGQLSQMDIHNRIRGLLQNSGTGASSEQELLQLMQERGLVQEVMSQIQVVEQSEAPRNKAALHYTNQQPVLPDTLTAQAHIDPTRRYLYVQVMKGRAFLDHLEQDPDAPREVGSTFTVHVSFRGQRFQSKPVPCAVEPEFNEAFLLELHRQSSGEAARPPDSGSLLGMSDPVHLLITRTDRHGQRALVSSQSIEWRNVLARDSFRQDLTLELCGVGAESKVSVGALECRLEVIPRPAQTLTPEVLNAQKTMERNRQAEKDRLFLVYAKQWWREYLQIRPEHSSRLVKIFAQDEGGTSRPVCSFVRPLRAGRLLDSARHAARFVALLGFERHTQIGGGPSTEMWSSLPAFLTRGKGDCEDHSLLLCSLLLGFGLEAYVCVGTRSKGGAHTWVMTRSTEGQVLFWESLNGHRFSHVHFDPDDAPLSKQKRSAHNYRTIGCVFNHNSFYANCQAIDSVECCDFDLSSESHWKCMSSDALGAACSPDLSWPLPPPLCPPDLDAARAAADMEAQLRELVLEHRTDQGLTTYWDEQLSYLLTPALAAYELERLTGVAPGNEEFQESLRSAVPLGHTFKGYPIQFLHLNARRAFAAALRSRVCQEVLACRGDHVRLALRVRVFPYPEQTQAVWIMFASRCKPLV